MDGSGSDYWSGGRGYWMKTLYFGFLESFSLAQSSSEEIGHVQGGMAVDVTVFFNELYLLGELPVSSREHLLSLLYLTLIYKLVFIGSFYCEVSKA